MNFTEKIVFHRVENIVGKGDFFPFSTMFSKTFSSVALKKLFLNGKVLTLSQTTNFGLSQSESLQTTNLITMVEKIFERVENTTGKGEHARYEQFLLFPQCFQMNSTADT